MGFIRFLFSKKFVLNVLMAIALGIASIIGLYFWLDAHTEHGITVEVPDFSGIPFDSVVSITDTMDIEFEIVDSLYSEEIPRGTVADQEPKPYAQVKRGRMIYLTVNAVLPQQVGVPDLRNLSFRQAKAILETFGLILGQLEYVPDIAKNAVLDQKINGVSFVKGESVFKGTIVDLVLGDGLSNTKVPVPYLQYLRLDEAVERIKSSSLNLATFKMDSTVTDTGLARVYKQIPPYSKEQLLQMGSSIFIYLTQDTASIDYDPTYVAPVNAVLDSLELEELYKEYEGVE